MLSEHRPFLAVCCASALERIVFLAIANKFAFASQKKSSVQKAHFEPAAACCHAINALADLQRQENKL
jgi:hypothetical protein